MGAMFATGACTAASSTGGTRATPTAAQATEISIIPAQRQSGPSPAYPEALRAKRIEGRVLADFVVEVDGSVNPDSFELIEATHYLFARAVRDVLGQLRFSPARLPERYGGKPVRQRVRQEFLFSVPPTTDSVSTLPAR